MSKNTKTNVTVNNDSVFNKNSFSSEKLLSDCTKMVRADNGTEIETFEYTLKGKGDIPDYVLTDRQAIEAIKGIQTADKLEKYATYRKGSYLVKLVDSSFMKDNELSSVSALASKYEMGVETSTANALEAVSRKLGVYFDENDKMHYADDTLPELSFWHYSQIISLVTADDTGNYDYSNLKEFITLAHVSPIMSQKRLKELFNDYRNGRLEGQKLALPESVSESAKKQIERKEKAEEEKRKAEEAKRIVSASVALEKAESFEQKQDVALTALTALMDCLKVLNIDYDDTTIKELIVTAEPPKATAIEKTTE